MEIVFSDEQDDPLPTDWLVDLAEVAMGAESLPESSQLSIAFIGEQRMSELNAEFMGKEGPTDVLSFPIEDFAGGIRADDPQGPPLLLGDIVICPSVVRSNATRAGVAFEDEMALMVVHGLLHLLGHDHVIEEEAEAMEQREHAILSLVGRKRP
jgi:probable rRNA maturation factor